MENLVTGVDIGGTHITVCLVNIDDNSIIAQSNSRAHIDTSLDKEHIIRAWTEVIVACHQKVNQPLHKIGIAMPGPFDYENGISLISGLHKYESLYGLNVKELLAAELNISPENIKLVNDASAYLLGEKEAGAGKEFGNIVGITLGTGLGSASYYNNSLEEGDLYCTDFEAGKCEDYVSARWLVNEYEKASGIRLADVKQLADSCSGDDRARMVFQKFGDNLYRMLAHRYRGQSPEVVVIGGNIAKAWEHFIPSVIHAMEKEGFRFELKPAELGEEAALIGAACLWKN